MQSPPTGDRRGRNLTVLARRLWSVGLMSAARQAREGDDRQDHASEAEAVRDELRCIGRPTRHADELAAHLDDAKVCPLVSRDGSRKVELRIFGGTYGDEAIDFVLDAEWVRAIPSPPLRSPRSA